MENKKIIKTAIEPITMTILTIVIPLVLAAVTPAVEGVIQNSKKIMDLLNEVIQDLDKYEKDYKISFSDFKKICVDILNSYKYLEENKDSLKQLTSQASIYKKEDLVFLKNKINLIKKANDNKSKIDTYNNLLKNMELFITKCDEFNRESYSVMGTLEKNKSIGGHVFDVLRGVGLTLGLFQTTTTELIKDISSLNFELTNVQKSFQKLYDTLKSTTQTLVQQHTESQSEPEVATTAPVATQQTTPTATEKKVTSLEDLADLNWG